MSQRLVLFSDGERGRSIIAAFADRTGLEAHDLPDGGAEFMLGPGDHEVHLVHTLTEIDPRWTDHLALGDPRPGAETV
jgi:hypothetical protein